MATAANIMQQLATGSNRRELPPKTPLEQREEFMDDLIRGKTEASLRAQEARNKAEQIQREGLGVDTDLILKDMGSSFFRPMLKDAWGRPLTRVPNNRAYSTGMFLRQTPKHQPVSLKGFESAHGEDGIDGKPVPADHWGIRGAFRNAPGMPKLSDFVKTDQFEMDFDPQHHGDAPVVDDSQSPFPGFRNPGLPGTQGLAGLRELFDQVPKYRFAGRAHETRDDMHRTEIAEHGAHLDPNFNEEAIQILAKFRHQYSKASASLQDSSAEDVVGQRAAMRAQHAAAGGGAGRSPVVRGRGFAARADVAGGGRGASGAAVRERAGDGEIRDDVSAMLQAADALSPDKDAAPDEAVLVGRHPEFIAHAHDIGVVGGASEVSVVAHYENNGVGLLLEEAEVVAPPRLYNENAGTGHRDEVAMRLAPPRPQRVIRVRCILAGTAAARTQSPVISVGDELVRVNDVDVTSSALLDVNAAIMGVPGTSVSLTLRRSLSQAARAQAEDTDDSEASSDVERDLDLWSYFNVRLVRGSAEYLALVDTAQALLQERNALSEQLEAARDEKDAQLKRVMALREQLHVSEEQIQREQLLASQLYYAKRTGAAVTAGELAFGARIKELEKELESKSSEARSLERQVSELSETVARLHESISAGQGALAPAVDRVSALRTRLELELQQTQLHSQSPDSLAQCLGRLVSAHSVFVSNVEAPYLPLPPPMMPRVSAVTTSRPEPKEWREASGITRSAPVGAAWSGLTEAAKSLVQAADGLQGGHQGGAAGGDGKDEAEGDLGGGKQLITAPAPVVYVDRCPESNRTQVNARLETHVTQTGQEQGDGGESEVIARAVKTVEAAAAAKETYVDWEEKLQHLLDATAPRFSCLAHAAADS